MSIRAGVLKLVRREKATYFYDCIPFQRAGHFNTWTTSNCQNFTWCDDYMKKNSGITEVDHSREKRPIRQTSPPWSRSGSPHCPCLSVLPQISTCRLSDIPLKVPVAVRSMGFFWDIRVWCPWVPLRGTFYFINQDHIKTSTSVCSSCSMSKWPC